MAKLDGCYKKEGGKVVIKRGKIVISKKNGYQGLW